MRATLLLLIRFQRYTRSVMGTILLTGYEPFGHTPINPAEQVARHLDGLRVGDSAVVARVVPNVFFECIEVVAKAIEELRPHAVLMMGEFGGRSMVTVERIAQNFNDSTRYDLLDNAGASIQGEFTAPDGPAAYYSTVPIRAMVRGMRAVGIPTDISDTPGTFGCNHLMYGVLHHVAVHELPIRVGWIHLPALPEVAALELNLGSPSMSVETSAQGVRAALEAIESHSTDIDDPIPSKWQL